MKKIIFFSFFFVFIIIFSFLFSSAFAAPLPPKTATITGTVTDSITHNPIVDATVSISIYQASFKTKTDTQGRYTLKIDILKPTFSIITAYKSGYSPSGKLLEIKPALTYTINFSLRDIAPPLIESLSIEGGASYTNKKVVTLTLVASDQESGLYQMSFSNDGKTWSKPESYASTKDWTLTEGDGLKTVYAKVKDKAGHWSKPISSTITLDTTPPTTPQVTDDGVYTTSATQLHASWTTCIDPESGIKECQYGIETTPGGTDTVPWRPIGLDTEVTHTGLSLTQGQVYYFSVAAINNAYKSSIGYSDGIIVDSIAPEGTLQINNDAQYTNSTQVTLTLSATDDVSGVDEMQFSNDGTNWLVPEPYSTTKPWNLSAGDGTKTVYAKFKDVAGNWSEPVSDTIILDTTAPTVAITSPLDGYISSVSPITVEGTIDDNQVTVTVNGNSATVSNGTFTAEGVTLTLGQNTITATATDLAGNISQDSITVTYQPSTTLSIDITSPQDGARVNTSSITVSGIVSDSAASVTVNGISAQVTNYTFTVFGIALTEGTNIITAKATKNTQTAQDSINVILDQDPPSISIFTPDNNSTTKSNIVYGRVSDDTQTVTVNGTSAELLSDFRFIGRAPLTEGPNTITVEATDLASNTNQASINITYNTTTPKVTITLPIDNSEINISPIKVEGTNTSDQQFILVNTQTALINNTTFTAEGITLDPTKTVVTASGYDLNNNIFSDSIVINSPNLQHYELQKVSGDTDEADPNRPQAGSVQTLIVKLNKNNLPASGEEIQFKITQGNGALSNSYAFTDINGEATITLTTDTDSDITNQVECYPSSNPLVKTTFYVDTKPAAPSILTKITDDTITPVPGATMPLIVKLIDQYQNPIPDETINFQITQGTGTLSSPTSTTNYYCEAKVNLACPNVGLAPTQVKASSNTNPTVATTFNITTSAPLTITIDDIINKVNQNDSKIQDIKADITVTSNAPFLPPTMQLKIWQKGEKQKVEEVSPEPKVYIRPVLSQVDPSTFMDRTIISYDSVNNIYVIKSKAKDQIEEYPYEIDYIDYNRGVILKTGYYLKENNFETIQTKEYSDFTQIGDIWGFQKETENIYAEGKLLYTTTNIYSNIQINTGIPDSIFQ